MSVLDFAKDLLYDLKYAKDESAPELEELRMGEFIAELSNGSQSLQKLNEQFRHIAPKLQIVSFYETRPTKILKKTQIKLAKHVHLGTIRTEGSQDDFLRYIHQELDVAGDDLFKEQIVSKILERARGNFLWVHLAVRRINKCHTKIDVDNALNDLPAGMEALYDRMAYFIQTQPNVNDQILAENILGWATCTQRPLSVEELSDALGNEGLLELHRTIGDLCGGFVVIDKEGKVAMVHATAREYLLHGDNEDQRITIDKRSTNNELFKRCIGRLMDPVVRNQIMRNLAPALLEYATTSWFIHLSNGSATRPDILEILVKFLRGQHILLWINVAARMKQLKTLVVASRHLADVALRLQKLGETEFLVQHQAVGIIARWATDLVKIVGKFGNNLSLNPESIYKLIPPFCPEDSAIYQQFGSKESKILRISGSANNNWDDCLTRFLLEQKVQTSAIHAAGSQIVILANKQTTGFIFIYNSVTFEEVRRITHPERVFKIQLDNMGDVLVSYGYTTTRVWKTTTGECVKIVNNPIKRPRPQSLHFLQGGKLLLAAFEDRVIRTLSLVDDKSVEWEARSHLDEKSEDDTIISAPTCSAISPGGDMIAFGYRAHPVSVWELNPPMHVAKFNMASHETDKTIQEYIVGEVIQIAWHPFSGEILGLHREGRLFRWNPYDDDDSINVNSGAYHLSLSRDGSLVATGDTVGALKVYATADLSLLYQLSSQDPILHLCFSTDSRRLYDVRGTYGNVWEPGTLVRLADSSEYPDHNSDAWSESESLAKLSLHTQQYFPRTDNLTTLAGQSIRPLYCYGTDDGIAFLCEVGRGKVCELERLTSYMPIEQIVWSEDGEVVAVADLSGRLAIKMIEKAGDDLETWHVKHGSHFMVPSQNGHIRQLLFHTTSRRVGVMIESVLPSNMPEVKWICHPTLPNYLLGFGSQLRSN
ncbi:putative Vegetative incompatibility protein HET-E-1 [Glarea lozoyensis 74030]|uniref:Putative Vegetative incompatibility protein HET-E-1 n=1 Tax=Glarea lozoyensis (strain ATCC 74030 / MF5533) TaxID=1104152 RepID=H0EPD8_GLAL7|nr:putative Vegetative incompatibility protein HET-E-1 [Glarea lozoyensis 74030]